jgi:hypothetical protein
VTLWFLAKVTWAHETSHAFAASNCITNLRSSVVLEGTIQKKVQIGVSLLASFIAQPCFLPVLTASIINQQTFHNINIHRAHSPVYSSWVRTTAKGAVDMVLVFNVGRWLGILNKQARLGVYNVPDSNHNAISHPCPWSVTLFHCVHTLLVQQRNSVENWILSLFESMISCHAPFTQTCSISLQLGVGVASYDVQSWQCELKFQLGKWRKNNFLPGSK